MARPKPVQTFIDGFEGFPVGTQWVDGQIKAGWKDQYSGYGATSIELDGSHVLSLKPQASGSIDETHAGLQTTVAQFGNFDASVRVRTVQQLRTGSAPNPWETGWVLWHYTDDTHFYYVALKTNGWEIGKEDPAYPGAQRYLLDGSSPAFSIGSWHTARIRQVSNVINVWIDGVLIATYTDKERPYVLGNFGLYCEDSHVHFDDVNIQNLGV